MTTVREARINTAMDTIKESAERYEWLPAKPRPQDRAKLELIATHVVDALFPDHTFDNVLIDYDPPEHY